MYCLFEVRKSSLYVYTKREIDLTTPLHYELYKQVMIRQDWSQLTVLTTGTPYVWVIRT